MNSVEALDLARRLVAEEFGRRASAPEPLASGEWSRAFALTLDGEDAVLRVGAHGEDFAKDEIVADHSVPGLRVPAALARGTAHGLSYAVSARARGTALDDVSAEGMDAALGNVLRALDLVADVDIKRTAGYGIWTPARTAPHGSWAEALLAIAVETPRVPGWRAALAGSEIGFGPFDAGLAALRGLAPELPNERRMVHGDLLSGNLLVAGSEVTAVLDWGNALYGDHLYDAAWLLYWWPWYPQWDPIDIRSRLYAHWRDAGRVPQDADLRLRAYQLHICLDAIAYCAHKGRWDDVARNAETVLSLI